MKFTVNHGIKSLLQYAEAHPAVIRGLSILWLAAIYWFAFLSHLGQIGLVDETEPLFAEAARQMKVTGDWVTPFFNGETRFDKPPLIYWLMAIAYQLFGTNEWAVRLPSALAAIALTSFGFYVLRRFGASRPALINSQQTLDSTDQATVSQPRSWTLELSAWLGAAMMALNPETIAWGRTGVSDMLLTGCVGAALLAFFMGYAQPGRPLTQRRWYLAFYILLALAVLTKGPVGVVLPGLIIGLFLLYLGNWRQILPEIQLLRGGLIFLVLTVPWYLLVIRANGQAFIQSFFGYHNLERFTSVVNRHDAPWYFYLLIIAIGFAPWSIYLPAAIAHLKVWRRPYWQSQPRSTHLGLFALFWVLGIFGFFTIAITKLPSYVLPLMPAAAILVALFWSRQITWSLTKKETQALVLNGWVNILFFCVLAGGFLYSPNWLNDDATLPNLRLAVQQANLPIIGAIIWGFAALLGIVLLLKRQTRWLWSVNFIAFLASLIFVLTPGLLILDAERHLPLRQLAAIAVQTQRPGEDLVMLGFKKPSLVFYTQQHITYLEDPRQARSYLRPIVTAPSHINSALVIALDQDMLEAGLKPDDYQDLAEAGVYQLVRVTGPNSFISNQLTM